MNKRILLVLISFLFCYGTTQAQDQKFRFGLKVSPTLAWLKSDTKEVETDGSKLGFSYGILGEYSFQEHYALASGVQVTYRGGKIKGGGEVNLQYVELPITLKMKTNEFDKFRFFGQFGFMPGLNIKAKDGDKNSIKDEIKNGNLAMTIAIGTEYNIAGSTVLVAGLEFNNGFLDITKSSDSKIVTNFFALNIGILF